MTDWTELKDLQAVAKAQADGWEIEMYDPPNDEWIDWDSGVWSRRVDYRGRPKPERKVVRVREAVTKYGVLLQTEEQSVDGYGFLGWVKGSQWREVEIE